MIIIYIILGICLLWFIINKFNKHRFVKLFDDGNVLVSGLRGRGKDMAFCVVVNHRKRDYISNVVYSDPKKRFKCFPLDLNVWNLSCNTYEDMTSGNPNPYNYPYPDGLDYYISDSGVYFPSQHSTELAKKYKGASMFVALSRHLGDSNVHCNVQNISRLWLHIREQSDIYVVMQPIKVFKKWCRLTALVYDNCESAEKQIKIPFFGLGKIARDNKMKFEIAHGRIRKIRFWTKIPYCYDDRRFKKILESNSTWDSEI